MVQPRLVPACLTFLIACASAAHAQSPAPQATPPPPSTPAPAPQEPTYPTVTVGVLSYLQYSAETKNRDGYNAFDVTRGYINIVADVAKNVRFRLTPDVRRVTDGSFSGSLAFRTKYAFAEFDNVLGRNSWIRAGLHQTPWLDFEESINRYRVQGQMFAEREGIIPGSGDFGVGYFAPLPAGYGEVNVGVYNGEGFGSAETNKYKSLQARGTIRPFPKGAVAKGLRVSGFYDAGWYGADHPRRHGIVMASFEHPRFVATAQWLAGTEQPLSRTIALHPRGASVFAELRQGLEGWAVLARIDHFDPDDAVPDNSDRRVIAGVAYWLKWSRSRIGFVLNDEDVRYDAGRNRPDENRLLVQTHVQF
jgi:hypothetical protein